MLAVRLPDSKEIARQTDLEKIGNEHLETSVVL